MSSQISDKYTHTHNRQSCAYISTHTHTCTRWSVWLYLLMINKTFEEGRYWPEETFHSRLTKQYRFNTHYKASGHTYHIEELQAIERAPPTQIYSHSLGAIKKNDKGTLLMLNDGLTQLALTCGKTQETYFCDNCIIFFTVVQIFLLCAKRSFVSWI